MKKLLFIPLIIGIILFIIGASTKIPGTELTTYSFRDGEYNYSSIKEYVNGDAYNYIIGANIVGSKIAAASVRKTVYIATGLSFVSLSLIAYVLVVSKKTDEGLPTNDKSVTETIDKTNI